MRLKLDIEGEELRANGARLLDPGWRWYYPYNAPEDRLLPELKEGDLLKVIKKEMLDKETQPPGRYGQGRLINIMEELARDKSNPPRDYKQAIFQGLYPRKPCSAY